MSPKKIMNVFYNWFYIGQLCFAHNDNLQEIVRKLKRRFNEEFDILYNIKQDRMIQINGWRNTLKTVLSELGDSTIEEMEELENKLQWTPKENPELDLPTLQGFH